MNLPVGHGRSTDGAQPTVDLPGPAGSALLSLVPAADRVTVLAAARRLCAGAVHDGLTSSGYDAGMVAVTVAAMAPTMAADRISILFGYCRATIELDHRLDSQPPEQAQRAADAVTRLIRATVEPPDADPFEAALFDILGQLRAHDPHADVIDRLTAALVDAVAAGVSQTRLSGLVSRGCAPAPSAADYLQVASRDVNFRSVALALVLLCGERPAPAEFELLDRAISVACRAVRLANDLATAGKDQAERRLNVIGLTTGRLSADRLGAYRLGAYRLGAYRLSADPSERVTRDDVERWIDQDVHAHAALLTEVARPGLATTTAALANGLRMAVGLYRIASRRQARQQQGGPAHGVRHQQGAARP